MAEYSFRARLSHRDHEILRGLGILANKQDVEIGAIRNFTAAKFSQSDNSKNVFLVREELLDGNKTCFGESGLFRKKSESLVANYRTSRTTIRIHCVCRYVRTPSRFCANGGRAFSRRKWPVTSGLSSSLVPVVISSSNCGRRMSRSPA